MESQVKTLGIISLIAGILALIIFCVPVVAFLIAAVGLTLGIIGTVNATKNNLPKSLVLSGLIISAFSFLLGLVWNIFVIGEFGNDFDFNNNNFFDSYNQDQYYDPNDIDTNLNDKDSLLMDPDEIDDLENSNDDFDNGPGPAPN